MALETFDIVNGIVLIIFCLISIFVGLRIILKYFEHKRREFIFVGLTWILLVSPWYPASISFLMFIFTGESLTLEAYFIIGFVFVPVALVSWMTAFTKLTDNKKQKLIVFIFVIHGLFYYIIFFYFLYTDQSFIGQLRGYTDVQVGVIPASYYLTAIVIALITTFLFVRHSKNFENPEVRLKAKFLLLGILFFTIGASLDAILPHNILIFSIFRTLEILAAIFFYCGFILPNWVKNVFLKEEKVKGPIP